MGLYGPAAADPAPCRGLRRRLSLAQGLEARPSDSGGRDGRAHGVDGSNAGRRPLCRLARRPCGPGGRRAAGFWRSDDHRHFAAAGLARLRRMHHSRRAGSRAALVAGGRRNRGNCVPREIHGRPLPRLRRAGSPGDARASPAHALGAMGGRPHRLGDRGAQPRLAGRKRLAVRGPHRRAGGAQEHPVVAPRRSCCRKC